MSPCIWTLTASCARLAPPAATPWGWPWSLANAGMLEVAYAGELVAGLNGLARLPGPALRVADQLGGHGPRVPVPGHRPGRRPAGPAWQPTVPGGGEGWWKLAALQEDVAATTPDGIVWIDDQLGYEQEAQALGGHPGRAHPCHLARSPPRNFARRVGRRQRLSSRSRCFDLLPRARTIDRVSSRSC